VERDEDLPTRVSNLIRLVAAFAALLCISGGCTRTAAAPGVRTVYPTAGAPATATPQPSAVPDQNPPPASQTPAPRPPPTPPLRSSAETPDASLAEQEEATLESLRLVNDHPLYTMHFQGAYALPSALQAERARHGGAAPPAEPAITWPDEWKCSLFAALGTRSGTVYGRNFDWEYSPALLLFTDPPDGYASVSMVDIAYLVDDGAAGELGSLSLSARVGLLDAPYMPFDGMNERGLAVGMAAVPYSPPPAAPGKPVIGSLMAIRVMLDRAEDVEDALQILAAYNVRWDGGPPLHYLIADASGDAALVEFVDGELRVLHASQSYHLATNHLRAVARDDRDSGCWRYELLLDRLSAAGGDLGPDSAMSLLGAVSQPSTQWSVVYDTRHLTVDVVTGRRYDLVHTFKLSGADRADLDRTG
jgi:hypothetical protein